MTISSTDGKIIRYAGPQYPTVSLQAWLMWRFLGALCSNYSIEIYCYVVVPMQRKGSDGSAESGSEVEDGTSPMASRNLITNPLLTPVHEEASCHAVSL